MAKAKQKQVAETPEEKAPEAVENVLSFEDFLKSRGENRIHAGLLASFMFEENNGGDGLAPRTEQGWIKALEDQSKRTY